jgi:dTDP-4-amino-4,6-dideoxygalactose transaminase
MQDAGIGIGTHYPAMHLFKIFRQLGYQPGDFPYAEDIGRRTVSLPLFPGMTQEDVDRVCAALGAAIAD